jgi:hypothetical protein
LPVCPGKLKFGDERQRITVTTFEATVANGQIRLPDHIVLPENTRVYVVVPSANSIPVPRIISPRLVDPRQAEDFRKEVLAAT